MVHNPHLIGYKTIILIDLLEIDTGYYYCHWKYLDLYVPVV